MGSKLISEIFSVEEKAEKLVADAKKEGQNALYEEQQRQEIKFNQEIALAKSIKEDKIALAEKESAQRVEKFKLEIEQKEQEDKPLKECAETIATKMVEILSTTYLKEGK